MNIPIIDPLTLTEEQREVIRNDYKERIIDRDPLGDEWEDILVLEWLFGEEFFEKGE